MTKNEDIALNIILGSHSCNELLSVVMKFATGKEGLKYTQIPIFEDTIKVF